MLTERSKGGSIPRLPNIGYLDIALSEIGRGASFERIRQALLAYAERSKDSQISVGVRSHLSDNFTFWSPTQESLSELMRLGFVESESVPSNRDQVDRYRATTYNLTPTGTEVMNKLQTNDPKARAAFLDTLTIALAKIHPGFYSLIDVTNQFPLLIPEYTIEEINNLMSGGLGTQSINEDAISKMKLHWPEDVSLPIANNLNTEITEWLNRRFPRTKASKPSQKDITDTINDAIVAFVANARNVRLDPISFDVCMSWGIKLAVIEQSRYVEGWPGRTIWTTFKIQDGSINRRGFKEATNEVVNALLDGFKSVALAMSEGRASGFLPIHRVRAQAAFKARVNLRFVDVILSEILSGNLAAPYKVQVALGRATPPPPSEPIFVFQGRRFFDILISDKEDIK